MGPRRHELGNHGRRHGVIYNQEEMRMTEDSWRASDVTA